MWPRLQMMKIDAQADRCPRDLHRPPRAVPARADARRAVRRGEPPRDHQLAEDRYAPRETTTATSRPRPSTCSSTRRTRSRRRPGCSRDRGDDARYRNPDGDPRLWKAATPSGPKGAQPTRAWSTRSSPPSPASSTTRRQASAGATSRTQIKAWLEEWGCEYELKDLRTTRSAQRSDRCRAERRQGRGSS